MQSVASQESLQDGPKPATEYKLYTRRWLMLGVFCMMTIVYNMLTFGYAPVATDVLNFFLQNGDGDGFLTIDAINLLSATPLITAIPLFIFAPNLLARMPLHFAVWFLCATDIIGAMFRYFGCDATVAGFWLQFVGQIIISLGQITCWAGPTKLSMTWFNEKERAIATGLASMSNLLGIGLSYVVSPVVLSDPNQLKQLMFIHMLVTICASVVTVIIFRPKPPTPPSRSSMVNLLNPDGDEAGEQTTYWKALRLLFTNRSFLLVAVAFGLGYGFFNGIFTVLNQMMIPQGYTPTDITVMACVIILCGLVGAVISGAIVDYTKRFKETVLVELIFAIGCLIWFTLSVFPNNMAVICAALGLVGFFALALTPVCLEVSVEYTYPVPESVSSGILMAISNILAIAVIFIMSSLQDLETGDMANANWFAVGIICFAFLLALFTSKDYRRLNYDKGIDQNAQQEIADSASANSP